MEIVNFQDDPGSSPYFFGVDDLRKDAKVMYASAKLQECCVSQMW
jgi:hypothetical protein